MRPLSRPLPLLAGLAGLAAVGLALGMAQQVGRKELGVQPDGSVLVPSNQTLTPVGRVLLTEGVRPKDLALSPDGKTSAVLTTGKVMFFNAEGIPEGDVALTAGPTGIAWQPDGAAVFASGGDGRVYRLERKDGKWARGAGVPVETAESAKARGQQPANPQPAGLAVAPDGKRLYVALAIRNTVAVLRLPEMTLEASVKVGVAPYAVALSPDGRTLVAANRGGAVVGEGEREAPRGAERDRPAVPEREEKEGEKAEKRAPKDTASSAGTLVRVDPKTDAALRGSLSFIDTADWAVKEVQAGRQPEGLLFDRKGDTLYVANSDEDTVSIVDVDERKVRRSISVRPDEDPGFGQIPTDVALSDDEKRLFVTCGGGNAVAVVDLGRRKVTGYMPAAWFPIGVVQREGRLVVASAKGIGARPENAAGKYRVHASVGTVQFIAPGDYQDLPSLSRKVAENNRWGGELPARKGVAAVPIPERVGEPSLFKYVVYIIKENHTYDLNFGDMAEGNGDPKLCLFPEEVTPNQHAIARQWVLLDNTYTSGTNSADGHQWTTSSTANSYMEHNYNAHARSYPYDGGDPLAYSPQGFLWTQARAKGLSVRVYGEFVNKPKVTDPATGKTPNWKALWADYKAGGNKYRITADTDNAALKPLLHPNFIGFPQIVSDQWRADQYLAELKQFEQKGSMPQLTMMLLPNDHTSGTSPSMPTPRAMTADNDLALGRILEALSRSRFWKETLVLVIEDDSQFGLDHVDGHRTVAMVASPYTKRRVVISEPYNHTSFARTIGLVLGLPAMTRFDRTATPLTECFTGTPDFSPYQALPNRIPLDEMNPPARALNGVRRQLAEASARLDWSDVDRADAGVVARAAWHSVRPKEPFPVHAFHPAEDDDDE